MSLQECSHDSDILSFLSQRKVRSSDLQLELRLLSFPSDFNIHWLSLNKYPYLLAAARSKVFYFQSFHACKEYSLVLKPFCSLWLLAPVQPVGLKLTWRQILTAFAVVGLRHPKRPKHWREITGWRYTFNCDICNSCLHSTCRTFNLRHAGLYILLKLSNFFALCSARSHRKRYKHETLDTSRVYSATVTFDFFFPA